MAKFTFWAWVLRILIVLPSVQSLRETCEPEHQYLSINGTLTCSNYSDHVLSIQTTVVHGTTAVTSTIRHESSAIPSAYVGIPSAVLTDLNASGEFVLATYHVAEPTTFVIPPLPTSWRIGIRQATIRGHSGVSIIYQNPYLEQTASSVSTLGGATATTPHIAKAKSTKAVEPLVS